MMPYVKYMNLCFLRSGSQVEICWSAVATVVHSNQLTQSPWAANEAQTATACVDWLSMVLRQRQHNIGYTTDGFYRSDDPTNSVKALKEGG